MTIHPAVHKNKSNSASLAPLPPTEEVLIHTHARTRTHAPWACLTRAWAAGSWCWAVASKARLYVCSNASSSLLATFAGVSCQDKQWCVCVCAYLFLTRKGEKDEQVHARQRPYMLGIVGGSGSVASEQVRVALHTLVKWEKDKERG